MLNTLNTNRLAKDLLDEVFEPFIYPSDNKLTSFRVDGNKYSLELEMAGADKKAVKAEVLGDKVLVTAKTKRKEYSFSSTLPKDADRSSIAATIKNGLLTIELEKAKEAKGHIIQVT